MLSVSSKSSQTCSAGMLLNLPQAALFPSRRTGSLATVCLLALKSERAATGELKGRSVAWT